MQMFVHRPRGWVIRVAAIGAVAVTGVSLRIPATAASKNDQRTVVSTVNQKSDERIAMPRRNLSPTITARRALGETFVDRVSVAFDVKLGTQIIGRLTGLVDLASGSADLRFIALDASGELRTEPFGVRVRGERMQISLPADLRGEAGVDGYVTTVREGVYGGVGVSDEVLIPIALLTALPLPLNVQLWNNPTAKTSSTTKTAKASKESSAGTPTTVVPSTAVPSSLRGVATRTDFKVFSRDRFGDTADVELALRPGGKLRGVTIRFSPAKTPEGKGLKPISLVGTVTRSPKTLSGTAPTGKFLTASKFFDLDPLPEDVDVPTTVATGIEAEAA